MSFLGIEIGTSALRAQRLAIERTGHNITNISTEGYSRQVVKTSAQYFSNVTMYDGQVLNSGFGTKVAEIERYRDEYLNSFYRAEEQKLGQVSVKQDYLEQVEALFNLDVATGGSVEVGLSEKISSFFNSLQDLTNNPTDVGRRQNVIDEANRLTGYFRQIHNGIDEIENRVDLDLRNTVGEINEIAEKLAELNTRIVSISGKGGSGYADMLDERDRLLDSLSELSDFQAFKNPDTNSLTLYIGSSTLVSDNHSFPLSIDTDGYVRYSLGNRLAYGYDSNGQKVDEINGGRLDSLLQLRDETLPAYSDKLDLQAKLLRERIDMIHKNGYDVNGNTGLPFFKDFENLSAIPPVTNNAGNIELSSELLSDPNRFAASVAQLTSSLQMSMPEKTINSAIPLNQMTADTFMTPPSVGGEIRIGYYDDTGTINTRTVTWDTGQSIEEIVNNINSTFSGINASFNVTSQKLTLTRDTSIGVGAEINVADPAFAFPPSAGGPPGTVYIQDVTGNFITGFASMPSGSVSIPASGNSANAFNVSNTGDESIIGNQFSRSDILDWQGFLGSLKTPGAGTPEERIYNFLDASSQSIITAWNPGEVLSSDNQTRLIEGLNDIIKSDDFYDPAVFTATLSRKGEELKNNYPDLSHTDMERLNRLIFETNYSTEITKSTAMTVRESYNNMLSNIGAAKKDAIALTEVYTFSSEQALNLREQVSGVSLDEEFSNLVKFQKAFEAAARFITVSDKTLDTVINGLGL